MSPLSAVTLRLLFPPPLPVLATLTRLERLQLECRALGCLLRSAESLRILLYFMLWVLLGLHLVWRLDRPAIEQSVTVVSAWPWLWLWTIHLRRHCVQQLLPDSGG